MTQHGPFDHNQTIGFYAGVGSAGTVIKVFDTFEAMRRDATPDVVAYGWVTCHVVDYDEYSTVVAPEPEREHCCTPERRCTRAASLARVYVEASTTQPPDILRAARALNLYTRHLRHRKVIEAGTTVRPTHPDTWED